MNSNVLLSRVLLRILRRLWTSRRGYNAQNLESSLGRVFSGVVEELSIVPVSSLNAVPLHLNRGAPRCATTSSVRHDLELGTMPTLALTKADQMVLLCC